MAMWVPDYQGRSAVNLMSSLQQALGGHSLYNTAELLPPEELKASANIVFLVIDGLGDMFLQGAAGAEYLQQHRTGSLHSVFPSTTAAAITTFLTGVAPQQHGLTGWFVNLEEAGGCVAVLPCTARDRERGLTMDEHTLARSYGHQPVFDQLTVDSFVVSPDWIIDTAFNRAHTGKATPVPYQDSLESMLDVLGSVIQRPQDRKYIYAYWPELDRLSHLYGQYSDVVANHLQELNTAIEQFCKRMQGTNTVLIISADHGFMDTTPDHVITLNEHPELHACLRAPLCGEPRLAYCYLRPDKQDEFVSRIQHEFSQQMDVVSSDELIAHNAFGLGEAHPRLAQRIGDVTMVMKDNYVIKDWLPSEKWFFHRGVHGGVSDLEVNVPVMVIEV